MSETITDMSTLFTPPASCNSLWTYEGSYYNNITPGLLIQNDLTVVTDCFPTEFDGAGRVPVTQIYSPGACPVGYYTAGNAYDGATTTATCCLSAFSYWSTLSSVNYATTDAIFAGCLSLYPSNAGPTEVPARINDTNLATTTVVGPLTMWAQPIYVAFRQQDISIFTTTTANSFSSPYITHLTSAPTASSTSNRASPPTATVLSSHGLLPTNSSTVDLPNRIISGGTIAGIVIASIAVIGGLIGIAVFFRQRKTSTKHSKPAPAFLGPEKDAGVIQFKVDGQWNSNELDSNELPRYHEMPGDDRMEELG